MRAAILNSFHVVVVLSIILVVNCGIRFLMYPSYIKGDAFYFGSRA